jgi:heptosyltransferase-2
MDHERNATIDRVLVIFPGALGDLICLIPTVRAIAARHPRAAVELMARMELAQFVAPRIGIARAHSIDRAEVGQLFVGDGAVADGAAKFFGGFGRIYSFFAADREPFRRALGPIANVTFHPFAPPGDQHIATRYLRAIGASGTPLDASINVTREDRAAAAAHLERLGLEPREFILVFPGSGGRRKNWPVARFVELVGLMERRDGRALVVLGPAEAELERVVRGRVATLANLQLREVAGLAAYARAFLGNDSGVSHLAAATGAPGVVLFGPTDPQQWRPLGNVRTIRREPTEHISAEEVAAELARIIDVRGVGWDVRRALES